jgi:hypothetical protein
VTIARAPQIAGDANSSQNRGRYRD